LVARTDCSEAVTVFSIILISWEILWLPEKYQTVDIDSVQPYRFPRINTPC
jgi:hypothetical protein